MRKRIRGLGFIILALLFSTNLTAQLADFEFLYDTICVDEDVTIINNSPGAGSYQWIFESAEISTNSDITEVPHVFIPPGPTPDSRGPYFLASIKVGPDIYTFTTKHTAPTAVYRQDFGNTFDNVPTNNLIIDDATFPILTNEHIEGIEIELDDDGNFYGFLVSEMSGCIFRLFFGTDITSTPTIERIDLPNAPSTGHDIELVKEGDLWYGFISYAWAQGGIIIVRFMDGLGGGIETLFSQFYTPSELGLSAGDGITGLGVIKNNGLWHIFGSVHSSNKLVRIDFSNDLIFLNSHSYGNIGGLLLEPRDISIAYDCGYLTGFVINENYEAPSLAVIHFGTATSTNITGDLVDLSAYVSNPRSLSSVYRIGGEAMLIIVDRDSGKLIRLKFSPNGAHLNFPYPANDDFEPFPLSYNTAGNYYVSLGLNSDLSTTYCKGITIIEKPVLPAISNTQICQGDVLYLDTYDYLNIRYEWTLPDNSTYYGQYPIVDLPGTYKVKMGYGGCYSNELSASISILPSPNTEIIPDTILPCQNRDFDITTSSSGGTPPYSSHLWSGEAANYVSSLFKDSTTYNGSAQTTTDTVFLSDINWESASSDGGLPIKDLSANSTPINLNGFEYEKGIGVTAYSEMIYDLNGEYTWFIAEVGLQHNTSNCGSVIFRVYTDGLIRTSTDIMHYYTPKEQIAINVNGRSSLRLVVETALDGNVCDDANWANARLVFNKLNLSQELIYRVTDVQGCNGYDTAIIILDTTTVWIINSPIDTIACETQQLDFPVFATGKGNLSYQWQKRFGATWTDITDNLFITGTNTNMLHFDSIAISDIGVFRCHIVSDICGESYTDAYRIQVYSSPIITASNSSMACGAGSVILTASPNLGTVRWYDVPEGGILLFESEIYQAPYVDHADTFYAEAFDRGCPSLARTPVIVDFIPPVPVDSFSIVKATLCTSFDGGLTFHVQGIISDYQFSIDSGNSWQASPIFTNLAAGFYLPFTKYNAYPCEFSFAPVQVQGIQSPLYNNITITPISDCGTIDGAIEIFVSGGTGNFQYSINNGASWETSSMYPGLAKNIYPVLVRNDDGSCETPYFSPVVVYGPEEIVINSVIPTDLPFCFSDEGEIFINTTGTSGTLQYSIDSGANWFYTPSFTNLSDDDYEISIRYESDQCEIQHNQTISLIRPTKPIIDSVITISQTSYLNPNGSLEAVPLALSGSPPFTYSIDNEVSWQNEALFNDLEYGNYSLIISNSDNSCYGDPFLVTIERAWKETIIIELCNNDGDYNLNDTVSHFELDLVWYDSQQEIITDGIIVKNDYPSGSANFLGIYLSDSIRISATFYNKKDAGDDLDLPMFCDPDINFLNISEIAPLLNNGYLISENGDTIQSEAYHITDTYTDLYLIISGDDICPADTALIELELDNLSPDLICTDITYFTIPAGLEYFPVEEDILVPSIEENCDYSLINSLTETSSLLNAQLSVGEKYITWTATDLAGNSNECDIIIIVKEFEVPNIFTPNGDGYNDEWDFIIEKELPNAIIYVYNRVGKLLFKSDQGYNTKWDGKGPDNQVLPTGAYQYVIINKEVAIYKGTVTILR